MASANINDYDPMTLEFGVIYEDHSSGFHPEDGSECLSQIYFVTATTPDGARFKRHVGTWAWMFEWDDEGYPIAYKTAIVNGMKCDIPRENLEKIASLLANDMATSFRYSLDPNDWEFNGAVYGSDAYCSMNIEEETAAFERESEYWG